MWTFHPDFPLIVEKTWGTKRYLLDAINKFETEVTRWGKTPLETYSTQKKLLRCLQGIHAYPNYPDSSFLVNLEHEINEEYNEILKREEDYWKLRSIMSWLTQGDANTKFFHTTTLNRRRRNKILSLQKEDGSWIYKQQDILDYTTTYFMSLFNSNHDHSLGYLKLMTYA